MDINFNSLRDVVYLTFKVGLLFTKPDLSLFKNDFDNYLRNFSKKLCDSDEVSYDNAIYLSKKLGVNVEISNIKNEHPITLIGVIINNYIKPFEESAKDYINAFFKEKNIKRSRETDRIINYLTLLKFLEYNNNPIEGLDNFLKEEVKRLKDNL